MKKVVYFGGLFALGVGVVTYITSPMALTFLRPLGIFLLTVSILLYWPMLTSLFRDREIHGGNLLGASVVLLSLGLTVPTIRQIVIDWCPIGSKCWIAGTSIQVAVLVLALVFIVAAPIFSKPGVSRWSVYWTLGVGAVFAVATYFLT